jgi:hypothetical protein
MPSEEEKNQPWTQQPGESTLWYRRFERFRLMVPVRSIPLIYREEKQTQSTEKRKKTQKAQPADPDSTWYQMARLWQWEKRAAAWDAELDAQLEQEIAAERKKILRSELALQHKRVELLNRKAKQLAEITDTEKQIWLLDVKSIGTGPDAERVDLLQFNDAAFKELREYLTDIADEMGERIKKHEAAITQLPPLTYGVSEDEEGCDP